MEYKEIIDKIKPELEKVVSFLERELSKIRSGTASISLVEDILVDCFGEKLPLKQLAAITLQGPRQILIQPWDRSYLESIGKAISQSNIGISPISDKDVIRINIPPLTGEFRDNLFKIVSEKQEDARKTVRRWREEIWREVQANFKEGNIREDDKFRAKGDLQKIIDDYNEKIEQLGERKKEEINR